MERRSFFKVAGLSAALLAVGGALGACDESQLSQNPLASLGSERDDDGSLGSPSVVGQPTVSFSSETDVLVVGSGIAGLSAATVPLEAGHTVMIADKLDLLGGESFEANGVMRVVGSDVQKQAGARTNVAQAWEDRKKELLIVDVDQLDFAKALFEAAPEWVDHLVGGYGAQFADPATYAHDGLDARILLPKNGLGDMQSVMVPLRDGLAERGATFSTGHRAVAFILSESGAVCGMRFVAASGGAVVDVGARCVVLATGGFASSQPLVHANTPGVERAGCYTVSAMGEGQQLCALVGGRLAGMDGEAPLTSDLPQASAWGLFGPTLVVDALGHRFAREDDDGAVADACFADGRGFWWTVFDRQLTEGGQSSSIAQVTSKNAKRFVGPCDDVAALADALGIARQTLEDTFDRYAKQAEAGEDGDFGRELHLKKLGGPLYALKQFPVRYKTYGGAKTDAHGRLLGAADSVIENVWCCGSVAAGSMDGLASNGAFGYLVGKSVAEALARED